jgi:hypothetical protein
VVGNPTASGATLLARNAPPGAGGALSPPTAGGATQRSGQSSTGPLTEKNLDTLRAWQGHAERGGVPNDRVKAAGIEGLTNIDPANTTTRQENGYTFLNRGGRDIWQGKTNGAGGENMTSQFENAGNALLRDFRQHGGPATKNTITNDGVTNAIRDGIRNEMNLFNKEQGRPYRPSGGGGVLQPNDG